MCKKKNVEVSAIWEIPTLNTQYFCALKTFLKINSIKICFLTFAWMFLPTRWLYNFTYLRFTELMWIFGQTHRLSFKRFIVFIFKLVRSTYSTAFSTFFWNEMIVHPLVSGVIPVVIFLHLQACIFIFFMLSTFSTLLSVTNSGVLHILA